MDADKKPEQPQSTDGSVSGQAAPVDALEKSSEELASQTPADISVALGPDGKPPKKPSGFKAFMKKVNLYLLIFILLVVIGVAISVVSYLNSRKTPADPTIQSQSLTQDTLKQLANSDATVGGSGQTLTVQGNAVFSGQVLIRSDLNVAGTLKVGTDVIIPKLTVSGTTNLADTQINNLQVASAGTFQGTVTLQKDLNVAGSATFNGGITAGQITVSKLIMSGNAQLEVPNHLAFTGASPVRSINPTTLGNGGSASVAGSDVSGSVNINTGNNPAAGCFVTVTFNRPFSNTPRIVVTPVGAAAGQTQWYVNRNTTTFSICTNNAAPANQPFSFDYFIAGL